METSSRFTSAEFVSTFRKAIKVSCEGDKDHIILDPVAEGEFVTTVNEREPHYFYMYTHVLQTLNFWLPFSNFECQMLRVMNVAPCQLHPNSWAFLKAFQVVCDYLEIVPTAGVFFSFFQVRNVSPHSLVSISSQPNKGRFSLYASNFKNYRDTFVRFHCGNGFPALMFDASGNHLFPFYWSSAPRLIKGTQAKTLNEYERDVVGFLSSFNVMGSGEIIVRENKPQSLGDYMSSMSTFLAQQRAAFVLKARAQKAEAAIVAASADAMAQLVVEEGGVKGTKRKNQEESSQISLEIPKKKFITIEQEEEDADEQPLKFKRVPRGKGSVPPNSGEGGSSTMVKEKLLFITCCPSNPELKKGKKSNLSVILWTKDFDSFFVVNESFQKYARTPSLSNLDFKDLRQAAMDHHIQGAMLSYYLSTRQELDTIEARNKMESANNGLSALEKEFAAAKSKFEEDLATVNVVVKAKDDEVIALKGRVKTLEGELDVATKEKDKATTQRDEESLNVEALTARIESLELEGASQFDDGFRFALDQVKVAFPDVDVVKLGELDSVNEIVDGKIVAYVPPAFE
ncbi:hypothetical protein TSUD_146840 [Trifolium subterraneum]|uniref:Transposase (putative) gypsy type domain-containing protein n=1 Tax=Trifolium subterraneum TaxID=3900 RepID=A0A2Z6M710_TRISU|nr:hypothetical protein TSUD_146840 [Trifolium subterraneum]